MQVERSRRQMSIDLVAIWAPVLSLGAICLFLLLHDKPRVSIWLLALGMIATLIWRRRAPLVVLAVCAVCGLGLWAAHTDSIAALALLVALYTVAAERPLRTALLSVAALLPLLALAATRFGTHGRVDDATALLVFLVATTLFWGTTVHSRRVQVQSLADRADQLQREREQELRLATVTERNRIAREMHDVVAHGLAVVITLSEGAAANARSDPDGAAEAMHAVAGAGREALVEMRRLLHVLRDDQTSERQPQPKAAALPTLIEDVASTGLDVKLTIDGALDQLDDTAQTALYRIVQEALTNVLKHGRDATQVEVSIESAPPTLRFSIQDNGQLADPHAKPSAGIADQQSGNGLTGIRERVALFDGDVSIGPNGDGWRVAGLLQVR